MWNILFCSVIVLSDKNRKGLNTKRKKISGAENHIINLRNGRVVYRVV